MFRKIIYVLVLSAFSAVNIFAQNDKNAEKLLTDVLNQVKTTAIRTNFHLSVAQKGSRAMSSAGVFTLKGKKFMLEMEETKAWFDGKTQWAYVKQNNEVSITEPDEKELSETNPMAVLGNYKATCKISFSKTKSATENVIDLVPAANNKSGVKLVTVCINKKTGILSSIKVTNTNGTVSLLSVYNFQKGINVDDSYFTFDKSKFKKVTINDLR